jgi:hypothetical protein
MTPSGVIIETARLRIRSYDDGVEIGGPGEEVGVLVGLGEVTVDGLEIDDAFEDAALKPLPGQPGEEAFYGIEP